MNSGKKSPITTDNWMQNSKSQNELDIDEGLNLLELNICIFSIEFIEESDVDYDDQEQVTAV